MRQFKTAARMNQTASSENSKPYPPKLTLVDEFKALCNKINGANCQTSLLDRFYSHDMVFEDSFHRIEGLPQFKDYCANLYRNVHYCNFHFHDQWLTNHSALLTWTMHYAHPKLNGSKDIQLEGATKILFEDKIHYHKDYFDGGALLYEHIPLMGKLIKLIKRRLT